MKRVLTLLAGFLCLFATNVRAADDKRPEDKPFDDNTFVQMAASGGMHEIALADIAVKKAGTQLVKSFAERMATDHSKMNQGLKKAATAAGITLPEAMNEHHQKEVDRFKDYKGEDFDRDYIKHMISDHEQDVALFAKASKEAKNPAIRDFAAKTLPIVEDHLAVLKKIKAMQ